ncbi:MAG TPA: SGNH/GDSL hydrolase family protein [Opitutaceae bacterium]|nr:SGNH/GDSL hydrolase family protein [Opitutaceae bacterium]
MPLLPGERLVMIGDSITEWGRPKPGTPGRATALGHGYVSLVAARLGRQVPPPGVEVLNRGVGGNTVRDLAARWEEDALGTRPHWLSVMIGINDVWRSFDPARRAEAVPPEEYERTLDLLLARARPAVRGLVLLAPFYVEPDRSAPMRARMDQFGAIVARLARRHRARFVDTQAEMDELMKRAAPGAIAGDRVHVGASGHEAIARAFLAAAAADG